MNGDNTDFSEIMIKRFVDRSDKREPCISKEWHESLGNMDPCGNVMAFMQREYLRRLGTYWGKLPKYASVDFDTVTMDELAEIGGFDVAKLKCLCDQCNS